MRAHAEISALPTRMVMQVSEFVCMTQRRHRRPAPCSSRRRTKVDAAATTITAVHSHSEPMWAMFMLTAKSTIATGTHLSQRRIMTAPSFDAR
jgi:hypothetical protein